MVLFDQVIQILAGSYLHPTQKFPIFLHLPHRSVGCCIGVQVSSVIIVGYRVLFIALRRFGLTCLPPGIGRSIVRGPLYMFHPSSRIRRLAERNAFQRFSNSGK